MWARIESGRVAELTDIDPTGRFHESLFWVTCPDGAEHGDTFDGVGFAKVVIIPPPPPVLTCSPWQIRKALNASGLRSAVEDAIAAAPDQAVRDGWEYATEFRRDDPLVVAMGAMLGKTEAELDALFALARSL